MGYEQYTNPFQNPTLLIDSCLGSYLSIIISYRYFDRLMTFLVVSYMHFAKIEMNHPLGVAKELSFQLIKLYVL